MKRKALIAAAVAGMFWSLGASALDPVSGSELPMAADETTPAMGTIYSLDTRTGGYRGWGPMANLQTPYSVSEAATTKAFAQENIDHQQQLAEVRQVRDQVWVANAPLRAEYENIGATRSHAGGFGSFFYRDSLR